MTMRSYRVMEGFYRVMEGEVQIPHTLGAGVTTVCVIQSIATSAFVTPATFASSCGTACRQPVSCLVCMTGIVVHVLENTCHVHLRTRGYMGRKPCINAWFMSSGVLPSLWNRLLEG